MLQKSLSNNIITFTFSVWKLVPSNFSRWNYLKFHVIYSFILWIFYDSCIFKLW
jgi:hypothetical protein